jgi:hypothetical protein
VNGTGYRYFGGSGNNLRYGQWFGEEPDAEDALIRTTKCDLMFRSTVIILLHIPN